MPHIPSHRRRKPLQLPMARAPGKFEGEARITEFIWDLTMEGHADEELGDAQDFGYYTRVSLGPEAIDDVARAALEQDIELTPAERQFIKETAGAILREDSQGFVYGTYYDTKDELDTAWAEMEQNYSDFMGGYDEMGRSLEE